jgi:hypothetical protein
LASAVISTLKDIAVLVEGGGEITLGHLDAIGKCVATATDDAQCLAMLVRRNGESLDALLKPARYRDHRRVRERALHRRGQRSTRLGLDQATTLNSARGVRRTLTH